MEKVKVLNQSEADANRKVLEVYVLKREDFDTEEAYADYEEEREALIYAFAHDADTKHAEEIRDKFNMTNNGKIVQRRSELWEANRLTAAKVLPLLGQERFQRRAKKMNKEKRVMISVTYSDTGYRTEMAQRAANWIEGEDIPVEQVGGAHPEVKMAKATEELKYSLFRSV